DLDRGQADPISILAVSGGGRVTDSLEVFPEVKADSEGRFSVRFFLHGLRHLGEVSIERASRLAAGDELPVMMELNNPATGTAVPLYTKEYIIVGWAPRYLVEDLVKCFANATELVAKVVRNNGDAAPINQRVMIEFSGHAPAGTQPMSTSDFLPYTT
ncbi:MAG: hypothetical protein ABUL49_01140, partial [bacterium]